MFIFIFIPLFTINIHHINLHYTMFIFISSASIAGDTLDIRFTFHYVYIYILSTLSSVTQGVVFTFHYVYIYMFSSLANITQGTIFTFHYVYIYITLQFLRCQGEIHLHSTMFIFILFALNSAINSGMIYIPLCLYLYGVPGNRCVCKILDLHSTMFIFISVPNQIMYFYRLQHHILSTCKIKTTFHFFNFGFFFILFHFH